MQQLYLAPTANIVHFDDRSGAVRHGICCQRKHCLDYLLRWKKVVSFGVYVLERVHVVVEQWRVDQPAMT